MSLQIGSKVYVVTNVEAGWDCVMGVFASLESLLDYFIDCGRSCYMRYNDDDELYFPINKDTTLDELEDYVQEGPHVIREETIR